MGNEQDAILLITRILKGDLSAPKGVELPREGDSILTQASKELAIKAIEASAFIGEISSGNLSYRAPRDNTLLGTSKELQSVLNHLLWTIECVSKGDFHQRVNFLGDFSQYFNLFITQVELREKEGRERAELEKLALRQKNEMLDELLQFQLEHYKSLTAVHKMVRGVRHDMKNHCFALNELLNQGEIENAQEYLSQISSQILVSQDSIYNTGNAVLDALLSEKISKAKSLGIIVHTQLVMGDRELSISNLDWCVLLGNTLDNAIEACQRLETGRKEIWIEAQVRNDIFNLIIKNTALPPKQREDGLYHTSKIKSLENGLGLGNVEAVAERYQGVMQTKYNDGFLSLESCYVGFK